MKVNFAFKQIKANEVSVLDDCEGSADSGFRGAMHAKGAVRNTRNSSVANQRDFAVPLRRRKRCGDDQQFGHAGRADRALPTQNNDMAGLNPPVRSGCGDLLAGVKT